MKIHTAPDFFIDGPFALESECPGSPDMKPITIRMYRGYDHILFVRGKIDDVTDSLIVKIIDDAIEKDLTEANRLGGTAGGITVEQATERAFSLGFGCHTSVIVLWHGNKVFPSRVVYESKNPSMPSFSAFGSTFSKALNLVHHKYEAYLASPKALAHKG